ncbi:MAG: twin-arginine translocase subunit TatC [Pseudomonadota bacterium]|nr:twin-arginine translocase subunit TatC [Pseudomonadota bacterium]
MVEYWYELRTRVLRCLVSYLCCFLVYFYFYDALYQFITMPMLDGDNGALISHDIIDPLVMPVTLSSRLGLLTIMPFIIFQLLSFIRPALYEKERSVLELTCALAVGLFYIGSGISFFLVEPALIALIQSWLPQGVLFLPTITSYINFSIDLAIGFGVAFEVPVILMIGILLGWIGVEGVRKKRSWWVVGIFFCAMLLTPPDIYSQVMLACPLWAMIELVLLLSQYIKKSSSD